MAHVLWTFQMAFRARTPIHQHSFITVTVHRPVIVWEEGAAPLASPASVISPAHVLAGAGRPAVAGAGAGAGAVKRSLAGKPATQPPASRIKTAGGPGSSAATPAAVPASFGDVHDVTKMKSFLVMMEEVRCIAALSRALGQLIVTG
jgi:hypothetical protein